VYEAVAEQVSPEAAAVAVMVVEPVPLIVTAPVVALTEATVDDVDEYVTALGWLEIKEGNDVVDWLAVNDVADHWKVGSTHETLTV